MSAWLLAILATMQFHVDSYTYDGALHKFTYKVGRSTYVCKDSQLASVDKSGSNYVVTLKGPCPEDRIHYGGFQK